MKALMTLVLALTLVVYPLLVYWGLGHFQPRILALALFVLVACRLVWLKGATRQNLLQLLPLAAAVSLTCLLVVISNSARILLINPCLISAVFLGCFGYTLFHPPSMVERFARLQKPQLPPAAIAYCRKVTIAWCLFFIFNGGISLWTALQHQVGDPLQIWTLYNGLISYLIMGLLGGTEYLIRRSKMAAFDRELATLSESVQ
jgi:uncharacterized membrane protein